MEIRLIPLQVHGDDRGGLIALEQDKNVPFAIKRVYYLIQTKTHVRRGFHAHKYLRQLAVVVKGSCTFLLDNGIDSCEVKLSNPAQGLLIEGLIWREMFDFSDDCVLMVLADDFYDEEDYIRDYKEFLKLAKKYD